MIGIPLKVFVNLAPRVLVSLCALQLIFVRLTHWSQNKDSIEHSVVSGFKCWSQLLWLALGLPILLPKKLCYLYSLLTKAARLFSLVLISHNIPRIIKAKSTPQCNLNVLHWTSKHGIFLVLFIFRMHVIFIFLDIVWSCAQGQGRRKWEETGREGTCSSTDVELVLIMYKVCLHSLESGDLNEPKSFPSNCLLK